MLEIRPAISGFDSIKRYIDKSRHIVVAKILPGELYVTRENELVSTVLGSCISACIWDEKLGIGGMNHFMLPVQGQHHMPDDWTNEMSYSCRYGHWAMEFLINEIIKNGGIRSNLLAKVFGGGKIVAHMSDVGLGNIDFIRHYLRNEEIPVVSHDVGGPWPRKILFHPNSGVAKVKRLKALHNNTIEQREKAYFNNLTEQDDSSDIELF
ncbi:chemoreceptor glutamine deamidase CheD [Catenovulum agarivorans DS-2]|uniref:Probable chemoreceptor glutamine deamidase CheD n=1 Tax=Catenovulum agarivorans DS-2 TaxID=1328313 RepID=W7QB25_9ALTE|nr:chemoreceptor glutamine deamidase CheD [Catenovulum agarivorans]EWH10054.1 chemoreceptor glutamine deamidase CheD [Catenovulum agarivorans DS-2]